MGFINSIAAVLIATEYLLVPITLAPNFHFDSQCQALHFIITSVHFLITAKFSGNCISFIGAFLWFEGAWVVSLTQNAKLAMSTDSTFTNYITDQ